MYVLRGQTRREPSGARMTSTAGASSIPANDNSRLSPGFDPINSVTSYTHGATKGVRRTCRLRVYGWTGDLTKDVM
jgi:hypothetical protein